MIMSMKVVCIIAAIQIELPGPQPQIVLIVIADSEGSRLCVSQTARCIFTYLTRGDIISILSADSDPWR